MDIKKLAPWNRFKKEEEETIEKTVGIDACAPFITLFFKT